MLAPDPKATPKRDDTFVLATVAEGAWAKAFGSGCRLCRSLFLPACASVQLVSYANGISALVLEMLVVS